MIPRKAPVGCGNGEILAASLVQKLISESSCILMARNNEISLNSSNLSFTFTPEVFPDMMYYLNSFFCDFISSQFLLHWLHLSPGKIWTLRSVSLQLFYITWKSTL